MKHGAPRKIRMSGQMRYIRHFIYYGWIDYKSGLADILAYLRRKYAAQIANMRAEAAFAQIAQHFIVYGVCAARYRANQPAAAYYGVKAFGSITVFFQIAEYQRLTHCGVFFHGVNAVHFLLRMAKCMLQHLLIALVYGNFGGCGAEIKCKYLIILMFRQLFSPFFAAVASASTIEFILVCSLSARDMIITGAFAPTIRLAMLAPASITKAL